MGILNKMNFKTFFEMSSLSDLLQIPQRPDYHHEGPVYQHTRMVRAKLEEAIQLFQKLVQNPESSLSELDYNFSKEDRNILRLAAWAHDIGKESATTIGDKHWREVPDYNPKDLRSIDHEMPKYFNPVARQLLQSPLWKNIFDNSSFEDRKELWFLVRNHMSLHNTGFSRRLLKNMIDANGKYKNLRRTRLLITFIFMDHLGREGIGSIQDTIRALEFGAKKRRSIRQSNPAPNNELEFVELIRPRLIGKTLPQQINILKTAMQGKFNRLFSNEEIAIFLQ
jgi:hypothetical protein